MKDYQLTSDGLYAYRWPRASVTADAVLFGYRGPRRNLQSCGGESGGNGRTHDLAERYRLCDPFAERDGLFPEDFWKWMRP